MGWLILTFFLGAAAGALAEQNTTVPVLTVCEALADRLKWNRELVIVVGRLVYHGNGSWLTGACTDAVVTEGYRWPSSVALAPLPSEEEPLPPPPFRELGGALRGAVTRLCDGRRASQRGAIWLAVYGRFQTREEFVPGPDGVPRSGYGHLGVSPAALQFPAHASLRLACTEEREAVQGPSPPRRH